MKSQCKVQSSKPKHGKTLTTNKVFPNWVKRKCYVMVWSSVYGNSTHCMLGRISKFVDGCSITIKHFEVDKGNKIVVETTFYRFDNMKRIYGIKFFDNCKNSVVLRLSGSNTHDIMDAYYLVAVGNKELKRVNFCMINSSYTLVHKDISKLMMLSSISYKKGNCKQLQSNINEKKEKMFDKEIKETKNQLANIGFSYNIQNVYHVLHESLSKQYLIDLNILCIIISYLLENKLYMNVPCCASVILPKGSEIDGCGSNTGSNDKYNASGKIWKAGKDHCIRITFQLHEKIQNFYGVEIGIPKENMAKKSFCYGTLSDSSKKWSQSERYLSEKNTINDIKCICCNNPDRILLYCKNNEFDKEKVKLTQDVTLQPYINYGLTIVMSKDIYVNKWFQIQSNGDGNSRKSFRVGIFHSLTYNRSWVPQITMLIGD